jgi:hypothetical protein
MQVELTRLNTEYTNRRVEQDFRIANEKERIDIEELQYNSVQVMNNAYVAEM